MGGSILNDHFWLSLSRPLTGIILNIKKPMKSFIFLSIMVTVLSCFTTEHHEVCPPLKWTKKNTFTTDIKLSGGHPYFSVGIRSDHKNNALIILKKLNVKCEIINKSIDPLKISWIANNTEEKKNGEKIIDFNNGSDKRKMILESGQKLLWYTGTMDKLLDTDFLTIQSYGQHTKQWSFILQLVFEDEDALKKNVNIRMLEIPVSASSSDNI